MKKKWYEWLLWIVYIGMIGLCVFLNFSTNFKEDKANIIVNAVMFIIVGVTFLWVDTKCFAKIDTIIRDLENATIKIKNDAMSSHTFLWDPYKSGSIELFKSKKLASLFHDYVFELNRKSDSEHAYYRPSIDDYVNDNLVDTVIHRNEMNQIAGMLTGLGILGTFIGLSLGLQNFNTGTTAEMTNSIEPLMNGIKVAFHTSIYGMVFSLVFNSIYKKKLYDADVAVDSFTTAFKKYVLPDTTNDGMNAIIEFQREQLGAFEEMSVRIGRELSKIITPQFDRLNETVLNFEKVATKDQADALSRIVNVFISEMNKSLAGSFTQVYQIVDEQYKVQKNNAMMLQDVMTAAGGSVTNLNTINRETEKLISTLNSYSSSVASVQNELKGTVSKFSDENSEITELLKKEQSLLMEQEKVIYAFKNSIDSLKENAVDSNDQITEALEFMKKAIEKLDNSGKGKGFRRGK